LQIVGFEVIGVVFVPLGTLPSVPFLFARSVSTGLLAIFESWMRRKPAATDPAWAFLPSPVLLHGSVPLIPLRENLPHKTQGLCHRSCRTEEVPQLRTNLYVPESESRSVKGNQNGKE